MASCTNANQSMQNYLAFWGPNTEMPVRNVYHKNKEFFLEWSVWTVKKHAITKSLLNPQKESIQKGTTGKGISKYKGNFRWTV